MSVVRSFAKPVAIAFARDLAFDGKDLWITDITNGQLHQMTVDGVLKRTYNITANPRGLTFDGKHLVYADSGTWLIYFVEPSSGIVVRTTPSILPFMPFPDAMTFDGKHLWIVRTSNLSQVNIDGIQIRQVVLDVASKNGLAFDGKYIWYTDDSNNLIVQIDRDGVIKRSFASPGLGTVMGLTFDGKYLWHVDEATNLFYQIKI